MKKRNSRKKSYSSNRISLDGNGNRLSVFFYSQEQADLVAECEPDVIKNHKVEINGVLRPFTEQTTDLSRSSYFPDGYTVGFATRDKIKYDIKRF